MSELQADRITASDGVSPVEFPAGIVGESSGSYVAVPTALSNISSPGIAGYFGFIQKDSTVFVTGSIGNINTSAANTVTKLLITLPIPITALVPVLTGAAAIYSGTAVAADSTVGVCTSGGTTQMIIQWDSTTAASTSVWLSCSYQIA